MLGFICVEQQISDPFIELTQEIFIYLTQMSFSYLTFEQSCAQAVGRFNFVLL